MSGIGRTCYKKVLHLFACAFGAAVKSDKDDKVLIMFEFEPIKGDDRSKRSPVEDAVVREERQSPDVPPEYFSLLQQLSPHRHQQQQQQQQQQQASSTAEQPQQQLIQQLVVSREGSKQPTATRFVLAQDGTLLPEGLSAEQYSSSLAAAQQYSTPLRVPIYQQSPLEQTGPITLPQAPVQPPRPGTRPQISEYARQQQRVLQEYRDAPLRAQIAGVSTRPQQRPVQPVPTGVNSQSAQVFLPPSGQNAGQQVVLPPPYQDPQNPGIIYTPVPVDAQTYYQQLASQQLAQQQLASQQLAQQQLASQQLTHPELTAQKSGQQHLTTQYVPDGNLRPVYSQAPSSASVPQQLFYPQPEAAPTKLRRPINVTPSPAGAQAQFVSQSLPQQYLIETSKPPTQQLTQFAPQEVSPQIQYIQQPILQSAAVKQSESASSASIPQPVPGRGLFTLNKPPSRSSIYVSRSSVPKSVSLTVSDDVTSEKVPVVRLPSPAQRTLSKQELDALISAGYTVTPIQNTQSVQYVKSKRQQQPIAEGKNHVVYENLQDGVQYQYSPGTSDATAIIKTKN